MLKFLIQMKKCKPCLIRSGLKGSLLVGLRVPFGVLVDGLVGSLRLFISSLSLPLPLYTDVCRRVVKDDPDTNEWSA